MALFTATDEKLNEPYVLHTGTNPYDPYRDNFPARAAARTTVNVTSEWQLTMPQHIESGDIVVPPDSYFGMGDNRDVSHDSRYWGFIPKENVIGRPMFIYWSFEHAAGPISADRLQRTHRLPRARGPSLLRRDPMASHVSDSAVRFLRSRRGLLAVCATLLLAMFVVRPGASRLRSGSPIPLETPCNGMWRSEMSI